MANGSDHVDYGDGTTGSGGDFHQFATAGRYTITVTTSGGAPRATWVLQCSDDSNSPNVEHLDPGPITAIADTLMTVQGGNLAGSKVCVSASQGDTWVIPWTTVDATGGTFMMPAAAIQAGHVNDTDQLFVSARRPDGVQGIMTSLFLMLP